jgi:hypothetical protein
MNNPAPRTTYEVVSCRIPYNWFVALEDIARIENKNQSQLLRDCIQLYFQQIRDDGVRFGMLDEFGNRLKRGRGR